MGKLINEVGNRYGKLTVLRRVENKDTVATWLCRCDCGNETETRGTSLRAGKTKSCGCRRARPIDETGNKYGLLTVLRRAGTGGGRSATWLCRCECGNEFVAIGSKLRGGLAKSCGCLWRLPKGLANARCILGVYRRKAGYRGLAWELTQEQFLDLTGKSCHYCGVEPRQTYDRIGSNGAYTYNGIDRVDNSKGYVIENCVPCCGRCNRAKDVMGLDEFTGWIARVYHHLNSH